jgi:hypothetical protein
MATESEILEVRRQFYNDFDFYSRHALRIRTKVGEVTPLVLNAVQKRFHAACEEQRARTGMVRMVIVKARQQGFSTYVGARMYWRLSQRKARKGFVVAHKADSTRALFDMYQRYHKQCPKALQPSTVFSSRKELAFDKLDTSIVVATAGGDSIARSETITDSHMSEVAFWPAATAAENLNALMQAIPNAPDTEVFIESTACGYNEFHSLAYEALAGKNGFELFFAAWFETPEYRVPITGQFIRTPAEDDLVARFGVDDEQLLWRRQKISQNGLELFQQEYPSTLEEAFIASGRPVFNPEQLNALLGTVTGPIRRMAVEDGVVREHPVGELHVYHEMDPAETYWIGADVGMGLRNGDPSVAQIFDSQKRQVAVWRGLVHPDYFADVLAALGYYYNTAEIAAERNAHGLLTCTRLWKDHAYPSVWTDITEGQLDDRESINIGFLTTQKTKPLIIDRLRAAMREEEIELNDETTLREMLTYIVTEKGQLEAEHNCFDDCVMALAIVNHIHVGRFTPVKVTDDFYCNAI